MKKKTEISIIRSSAAEYLTFITATGESDVNAVYFDENVWLTQKTMGLLYNVETHTINYHLKKIFADGELEEQSVIRKFRITASDGKCYNTNHYNLKAIIAVGNKVDSARAIQFRKWANGIIEEFTIKGFAMDDERLKNFGTVLTKDYFEEQIPMTMEDWAEQFEGILKLSKKEILTHAGTISAKIAGQHALSEFEKYRVRQDQLYQSDFDRMLLEIEEDDISENENPQ